MIVNTKKYFYNFTVRDDDRIKFAFGVLTVDNESNFDPLGYIKEYARKEYPDHTSLNITALNLI